MPNLKEKIKQEAIIYVTRDIERAVGIKLDTQGYHIISNQSNFASNISKKHDNVYLYSEEKLDTRQLLKQPEIKNYIQNIGGKIVVFKNTKQIQRICNENDWELLNPDYSLINQVEQKISQIRWLDNLTKYMPEFVLVKVRNIDYKKEKFILQFNRAHTGNGTILIDKKEKLEQIKNKFPDRPAKVVEYIEGEVYTLNCIVAKNDILFSSPSYQITGMEPFTNNDFATIGNDWGLADDKLNQDQIDQTKLIGEKISKQLRKDGFVGLFGIDVIITDQDVYLLEINARQPASTTFESKLQTGNTTFRTHLSALLGFSIEEKITKIDTGAQIIYRNQPDQNIDKIKLKEKLEQLEAIDVIIYYNTQPNTEALRIMSQQSLMQEHNQLNSLGKKIANILQ